MIEPLAHSARDYASEQTYRDHVGNVVSQAMRFGREAAVHCFNRRDGFLDVLEMAAHYHDLGKLDDVFQDVLANNRRTNRGLLHWDASSAHLLRLCPEAAVAAYSHHKGLPSFPQEQNKNANGLDLRLREIESEVSGEALWQRSHSRLDEYLTCHHAIFPLLEKKASGFGRDKGGLRRRLLLSCLVDADHSDTARHYRNEREVPAPDLHAAQRLARLDEYVARLSAKNPPTNEREQQRFRLRQEVYRACREREIRDGERILACDSPVGTGKTTAVMAHLLRAAAERKLRRVFVVLPFTNIIDQSVEVYRRALRLDGESEAAMESVVAAHHHRVDFSSYEARCLAARWDSPIVVTTAVQFFETLAARDTASLRKFHQVAGSAIFVDEAHAAVPPALWPQMLRWLRLPACAGFRHAATILESPRFLAGNRTSRNP